MSLPPQVQTHIDQIVQLLGLQALRPESMTIHFDHEGIAQVVKPQLTFKRKALDGRSK